MPSLGELLDITGIICLFILFLFFSASLGFLSLSARALVLFFILCVFILVFGMPYQNIPLSLLLIVGLGLFLYWGYSNRMRAELTLRKSLSSKNHGVEWTQKGFIFKGIEYSFLLFIRGKNNYFLAHFFITYPDNSKILYPAVFCIQSDALIMA